MMASSRGWVLRAAAWWAAAFILGGSLLTLPVLAASPTGAPAPLRLVETGVDATRGEIWALVENTSARPVAAGVEWRLWVNADLYGRSVVTFGELPALEAGDTYRLILAAPKPSSLYRLQLVMRAAHGYTGSIWSDELAVPSVAEETPTAAPTEPALALVALPLVVAPEIKPTPTQTMPPLSPSAAPSAPPTAELHRVLMPAIAQPPATAEPTPQAQVSGLAPDPISQLAIGALAVLLVVGAIAIVRHISHDDTPSPPPAP